VIRWKEEKIMRKKNCQWCACIAFLYGLFLGGSGMCQLPENSFSKGEEAPHYFYDVVSCAAKDSATTAMVLYTKVSFDELQFVQKENRFRAEYELSTTVFDQRGDQADNKIFRKEVFADTYKQTNSRTMFSIEKIEFQLPAGKYDLLIGMLDLDSKKTGRRKTKVEIPDYTHQPLNVSDILFVDQIEHDSLSHSIPIPNVMSNYSDSQRSLFLWFEIYDLIHEDSVQIVYRISDLKNNEIRKWNDSKRLAGFRTIVVTELERGDLKSGKYKLELSVQSKDHLIQKTHDFSIHWTGMPTFDTDLDKAIEQLKYIAKDHDIKKLKKAKEDEKAKLFQEFWNAYDGRVLPAD
jgi:hypothetical protein